MVHTTNKFTSFVIGRHQPETTRSKNHATMADCAPLASAMVAVVIFARGPFPAHPREHVVPVTPEAQQQQRITACVRCGVP